MALYTLADLHLATDVAKPMDIFGGRWEGHTDKIIRHWRELIAPEDTVVLGGDISWGISLAEAKGDFALIDSLPGRKSILKGNVLENVMTDIMFSILSDSLRSPIARGQHGRADRHDAGGARAAEQHTRKTIRAQYHSAYAEVSFRPRLCRWLIREQRKKAKNRALPARKTEENRFKCAEIHHLCYYDFS